MPYAARWFAAEDGNVSQRSSANSTRLSTSKPRRIYRTKSMVARDMFDKRHGSNLAAQLREHTKSIDKALKYQERSRRYVLHPEKNNLMGWWDLLTSLALVYTATLTPFETSFLQPVVGPESWRDGWFIANRVLDVIFLFDMVLQFFVAYQSGNAITGDAWVDDHARIINHYLKSWFGLDAATVLIPGAFDLYLASDTFRLQNSTSDDVDVGAEGRLGILRVLRVLRLIKLVRLVRASRIVDRWRSRIAISHASQTWLSCAFVLLVSSHWFACIIALQAGLHPDPEGTWLGKRAYGLCDTLSEALGGVASLDSALHGCSGLSVGSWYLAAYCWSTMVITGVGGTDYYPSGESDAETAIVMILVVIGSFLWTLVLASFCDVATNSSPTLVRYRQQLDSLNMLIAVNNFPPSTARRMRAYFQRQKQVMLREDCMRSLPYLSQPLQIEVILHMNRHWLDSVWFIKDLEASVKVQIAMRLEPRVLAPKELAPCRHLYVMNRGTAMFGSRVLTRGMAWGDDVILTAHRLFIPFMARAITFSEVSKVAREAIYEVVDAYPHSARVLRRSTLMLALRRGLIAAARYVSKQRVLGDDDIHHPVSSKGGNVYGTFLRKVYDATQLTLSKFEEESQQISLTISSTQAEHGGKRAAPGTSTGTVSVTNMGNANPEGVIQASVVADICDSLKELRDVMKTVQCDVARLDKRMERMNPVGDTAAPDGSGN